MKKKVFVSYQLGQDWYKLEAVGERPKGKNNTHYSLQEYFLWDGNRFPSCAGRRFDEVNVCDKRPLEDLMRF